MADDDEYKDDHIEEEGPPPAPSSTLAPPTVQPFSHSFIEFPGLPGIKVPARAFDAKVKVSLPSGSGRDSNTIIVNRGERGMAALEPRNMEPSEAQQALRDFSHLYPVFVQKWNKGYLNEVAFATKSKAIAEAHMLEGRRKMLAEEAKARQALFPHRKKNPEGESGETFFDRCAAMDKRLQEKRVKAVEDYEKAQRPPPTAKKWGEVQDNFLKRWIDFNKKREENLEKLDKETMPPFRQPNTEPLVWEEVQEHFLGSQAECTARIEARVKAAEEAMKTKSTKEGGADFKMKPYNFSKPLPKFDDRQAAFADTKKLEYEERLDRWGGGASDEGTSFKTKPFPFSKPLEPFFERQESQRAKSDEEGKKRRKEAEERMAKKH